MYSFRSIRWYVRNRKRIKMDVRVYNRVHTWLASGVLLPARRTPAGRRAGAITPFSCTVPSLVRAEQYTLNRCAYLPPGANIYIWLRESLYTYILYPYLSHIIFLTERFAIFFSSSVTRYESGGSAQGLPGPSSTAATATATALSFLPGIVGLGFAQRTLGRRMPGQAAVVATVTAAPGLDGHHRRRSVRMFAVQRGVQQPRSARETRTSPFAQRPSGKLPVNFSTFR